MVLLCRDDLPSLTDRSQWTTQQPQRRVHHKECHKSILLVGGFRLDGPSRLKLAQTELRS